MNERNHQPGSAADVLERALRLIGTDIEGWLALFADDAVVDMPYAASMGRNGRFEGKEAIARYFRGTPAVFRHLTFRDLRLVAGADHDVAFAEVHGSAVVGPEARPYAQDYVMILHTRDGKAVHYREYWNPLPGMAALDGQPGLGGSGS